MPDFMTLKYAIYFIVPAAALYVAAFVFGGVLVIVAQFFVQRDISHDEAGRMMAVVIAAAAGVAAFVQWTTESLWATVAAGSAASYIAGSLLFSWTIKDFASSDRKNHFPPIGPKKGSLMSAVMTLIGLTLTLLILWGVKRTM